MRRHAGLACAVLVAAASAPGQAFPQEPVAASRASPPVVHVFVAGSSEVIARTRVTLQELGSRLDLILRVRDASDAEDALTGKESEIPLVRAYVDLRSPASPRVVVADGKTHRTLVRRSLAASSSLELSVEAATHVVLMAVESALGAREAREADRRAVTARPPGERVPVEPMEPPRKERAAGERARWDARGSLFGSAVGFGSSVLPGAGAAIDASTGGAALRFGGLLSVAAYLPAALHRRGAEVALHAASARVAPALEWQATPALAAFGALGTGADWVRLEPTRAPPSALTLEAEWRLDPVAAGLLGARVRMSRGASVFAGGSLDVDLSPHRYVIESTGERQVLLELARLRPAAFIGLSATIFGGPEAESTATVGRDP